VARFRFFLQQKKSSRGEGPSMYLNGWTVCPFHGAGGAPEGKRDGNYRHGCRTKEMIAVWKQIKLLR
jgi:hypothetical protein